jgi:hypothetical protein
MGLKGWTRINKSGEARARSQKWLQVKDGDAAQTWKTLVPPRMQQRDTPHHDRLMMQVRMECARLGYKAKPSYVPQSPRCRPCMRLQSAGHT